MTHATGLEGRHALVCGGSQGIGRASAVALARRGAAVTVLARSAELLQQVVKECEEAGALRARFLVVDLDQRPEMRATVSQLLEEEGPVHVLINNTGGPEPGLLVEADAHELVAGFCRHVLSAQRLVQIVLPGMREAGYGRIVNVISTSVREPIPGLGVSNTIRGAMASWAKTLSRELPPGITINNVLPGFTATERLAALAQSISERTGKKVDEVEAEWLETVPEGRFAQPEEIGAAVAWLASPEAAYVRGVSLPVDGGRMRAI